MLHRRLALLASPRGERRRHRQQPGGADDDAAQDIGQEVHAERDSREPDQRDDERRRRIEPRPKPPAHNRQEDQHQNPASHGGRLGVPAGERRPVRGGHRIRKMWTRPVDRRLDERVQQRTAQRGNGHECRQTRQPAINQPSEHGVSTTHHPVGDPTRLTTFIVDVNAGCARANVFSESAVSWSRCEHRVGLRGDEQHQNGERHRHEGHRDEGQCRVGAEMQPCSSLFAHARSLRHLHCLSVLDALLRADQTGRRAAPGRFQYRRLVSQRRRAPAIRRRTSAAGRPETWSSHSSTAPAISPVCIRSCAAPGAGSDLLHRFSRRHGGAARRTRRPRSARCWPIAPDGRRTLSG